MAIRICDRLCTLIENQSHCVKKYKFLILSIIEHVFNQVVPVPAAEKQKKIEEVKDAKRTKAGGGATAASEEKKEAEAPEDAESTEKSKKLKFFG